MNIANNFNEEGNNEINIFECLRYESSEGTGARCAASTPTIPATMHPLGGMQAAHYGM